MPFRIALSGLNASTADLRVISNNIANSSTTGFKKSRAEFADIYAASNLGVSSNAIGSGVRVAAVAQQFTQGNIGFTDNNLDLAISGQGFYRLNDNGVSVYSRAGSFSVDRSGYVVNNQAQRLTAYQADAFGNITGALGDLWLDTSDIAPSATTSINAGLNVDASMAVPVTPLATANVTSTDILDGSAIAGTTVTSTATIYDSYGISHTAVVTYTKTINPNEWSSALTIDAIPVGAGSSNLIYTGGPGVLLSPVGGTVTYPAYNPGNGAAPISLTYNMSGTTQNAAGPSSGNNLVADGSAQGIFDPTLASTYNSSTSLTVYDSLGGSHLATLYFRKTGVPNEWQTWSYVDGVQVDGPDQLTFSSLGQLSQINGVAVPPSVLPIPSFNLGNGSANLAITIDYTNITQYGSPFSVNSLVQDGYATGRLNGVDVGDTGIVQARFTNGRTRTLGQVALANFSNPQGLRQLGDTTWAETFDSGAALVGAPGTGSLGLIQSGALEGSNVDLTEQLVNMITAQRNFQANAQVISTADAITQSIINIRR